MRLHILVDGVRHLLRYGFDDPFHYGQHVVKPGIRLRLANPLEQDSCGGYCVIITETASARLPLHWDKIVVGSPSHTPDAALRSVEPYQNQSDFWRLVEPLGANIQKGASVERNYHLKV